MNIGIYKVSQLSQKSCAHGVPLHMRSTLYTEVDKAFVYGLKVVLIRQHKQLMYFILYLHRVKVYLQGTLGDLQTNLEVFIYIACKGCYKIFWPTKFVTSALSFFF